jgi:DNA-binding LacI/PurR family transcriptional regulator
MGKQKVILRHIAEQAGVSVSTVSLVLNDKAVGGNVRISERTILDLIDGKQPEGAVLKPGLIVRESTRAL